MPTSTDRVEPRRAGHRRLRRRFVRGERGAAMVEFALATPLLITLAFGVVDFGRAFYAYNKLSSVVRDGARFGAAQGSGGVTNAAMQTTIQNRISSAILAEYGLVGAVAPGTGQVAVSVTDTDVTVTVQGYSFNSWTPILPLARNLTLNTSATFRREILP
jgi:Flp pilus assembly protein TadG